MEKIKRLYSLAEGIYGYKKLKKKCDMSVGSILEKQSAKYGDKSLVLFEEREISYKQFNEMANRYSHFFQRSGFIKGDTVAVLIDNRPEFLIIHAGLAKIGVI